MWRIRWSTAAAADLEGIKDYLSQHRPELAQPAVVKVYNAVQSLKTMPHRGRPGQQPGTRELLIPPLPYVIVYQIAGQLVFIARILHTSQDRR